MRGSSTKKIADWEHEQDLKAKLRVKKLKQKFRVPGLPQRGQEERLKNTLRCLFGSG